MEELDEKERYWIKKLNCKIPNGYNILDGGQKYRVSNVCSICGKGLSSKNSKTGLCLECYKKEKHKNIPSKEQLFEKILAFNGVFTKIASYYGVTDNAVRKWCKSYGMPFHSKDYKTMLKIN